MQLQWKKVADGVYDAVVVSAGDGIEYPIAQVGQEDQTYAFVARELVFVSNATDDAALQAAKQAILRAMAGLTAMIDATCPLRAELVQDGL